MLDGLGVNQLLELLLLGDQQVVLVGVSLGGDSVEAWTRGQEHDEGNTSCKVTGGHVLTIDHGDGEVGGGYGDLAGLVEGGLGGVGVEDGGDGLTWDHEVSTIVVKNYLNI